MKDGAPRLRSVLPINVNCQRAGRPKEALARATTAPTNSHLDNMCILGQLVGPCQCPNLEDIQTRPASVPEEGLPEAQAPLRRRRAPKGAIGSSLGREPQEGSPHRIQALKGRQG